MKIGDIKEILVRIKNYRPCFSKKKKKIVFGHDLSLISGKFHSFRPLYSNLLFIVIFTFVRILKLRNQITIQESIVFNYLTVSIFVIFPIPKYDNLPIFDGMCVI